MEDVPLGPDLRLPDGVQLMNDEVLDGRWSLHLAAGGSVTPLV